MTRFGASSDSLRVNSAQMLVFALLYAEYVRIMSGYYIWNCSIPRGHARLTEGYIMKMSSIQVRSPSGITCAQKIDFQRPR